MADGKRVAIGIGVSDLGTAPFPCAWSGSLLPDGFECGFDMLSSYADGSRIPREEGRHLVAVQRLANGRNR